MIGSCFPWLADGRPNQERYDGRVDLPSSLLWNTQCQFSVYPNRMSGMPVPRRQNRVRFHIL